MNRPPDWAAPLTLLAALLAGTALIGMGAPTDDNPPGALPAPTTTQPQEMTP